MKSIIYGIVVACFFTAGTMDLLAHQWREGAAVILLGVVNAVIFLGR